MLSTCTCSVALALALAYNLAGIQYDYFYHKLQKQLNKWLTVRHLRADTLTNHTKLDVVPESVMLMTHALNCSCSAAFSFILCASFIIIIVVVIISIRAATWWACNIAWYSHYYCCSCRFLYCCIQVPHERRGNILPSMWLSAFLCYNRKYIRENVQIKRLNRPQRTNNEWYINQRKS